MTPQQPARPYWKLVSEPALVLLLVLGLAGWMSLRPQAPDSTPRVRLPAPAAKPEAVSPPFAVSMPDPAPRPPAPVLDPALRASAEADLDAASRDRARAEDRAARVHRELEAAQLETARVIRSYRDLGNKLRFPTASLTSLRTRGATLEGQVKQIDAEMRTLAQAPKPRKKPLLDRTPVARIVDGQEYHFELQTNRISYIDLDRLVAQVKADAQLQLRLSAGSMSGRPIISTVGPIGAYSIRYELARSLPTSIEGMLRSQGQITYSLTGWEIVPERDQRGETFEATQSPASDFSRAINSLSPDHATITLWIYPDSFRLYRALSERLHERGFVVAARPLPAGMPIRGSPGGSMSAGQ